MCVEPLTVVEAALRRLSRELPSAALVVGAGPQGLLMCLALMMRGVEVHVLDVNDERLAFAGASRRDDRTDRQDSSISWSTASAHRQPMSRRWRIALRPATILVLGLDDRPLGLSARTLVRRQLELRGSLTYDHPADFRHTIELVSSASSIPAGSLRTSMRSTTCRLRSKRHRTCPARPGSRSLPHDPEIGAPSSAQMEAPDA